MLEGGVRRLLMLEGVCCCDMAEMEPWGRELLNFVAKVFVGSSRGPGRLEVAVRLEVRLELALSVDVCGAAPCGGSTAAMLYDSSLLGVWKVSVL